MISTSMDAAALQHFQASLNGVLLDPSDAAYNRARLVWNGRMDCYPAVFARCANASNVIHVVQCARAQFCSARADDGIRPRGGTPAAGLG